MRKTNTKPIADQPTPPEPAPVRAPPRPLPEQAFQLAEQCFRCWHFDLAKIKAEDGSSVSLQDFMRPGFWAKWVDRIGVDDRIRVIAADRSFDFEVIVKVKQPGVGLMLEIDRSKDPSSPVFKALVQASQAARAVAATEQTELNRAHGVQDPWAGIRS
jgi:hypothetical protein